MEIFSIISFTQITLAHECLHYIFQKFLKSVVMLSWSQPWWEHLHRVTWPITSALSHPHSYQFSLFTSIQLDNFFMYMLMFLPFVHMSVCAYLYAYMPCIWIYMYIWIYFFINVFIYTYIYISLCIHIQMYIYVYIKVLKDHLETDIWDYLLQNERYVLAHKLKEKTSVTIDLKQLHSYQTC